MWSLFFWLTATEWSFVILYILISMNLHQPLESQYSHKYRIFINNKTSEKPQKHNAVRVLIDLMIINNIF